MRTQPVVDFLTATLLVSGGAFSQSAIVVPARAGSGSEGTFSSFYWLWGAASGTNAAHVQALYASSEIPVASAGFTGLAVRRATHVPYPNVATTVQATLRMAQSSASVSGPSPTFAANAGASPVTVFSGTLNLPARAFVPWPAPWESQIGFSAPFAFAQANGATFVVDVSTSQNSARAPWYAECTTLGYGDLATELVQSSCLTSEGGASGSWGSTQLEPYVGGSMAISYLGMPSKVASFATARLVFGLQGAGGTFLGKALPFLLADLGLAARPNCRWTIDWVVDLPLTYTQSNGQNQGTLAFGPITLPSDPTLAGARFFTQGLALDRDPATSQLQLFPTLAHRWTIGSGRIVPVAVIYKVQDTVPASATGAAIPSEAPTLKLLY